MSGLKIIGHLGWSNHLISGLHPIRRPSSRGPERFAVDLVRGDAELFELRLYIRHECDGPAQIELGIETRQNRVEKRCADSAFHVEVPALEVLAPRPAERDVGVHDFAFF